MSPLLWKSSLIVLLGSFLVSFIGCSEKDALLAVHNTPPILSEIPSQETNEDTPTAPIALSLSDKETPEAKLDVSITSEDWNLTPYELIEISGEGANRELIITPGPNQFGSTKLTVSVSDGEKTTVVSFELTVHPINDPPVADGLSVNVNGTESVEFELTGTDVEDDPLTFELVEEPELGTLSGEPPFLSYTPNQDLAAHETFTFRVHDGELHSEPALVEISIRGVNSVPVGASDLYTTVGGCSVVVFSQTGVLSNDSDADGEPITASLHTPPQYGTLEFNADGSFIYTPIVPLVGDDAFYYTVSDAVTESEPIRVDLKVDLLGVVVDVEIDGIEDNGRCSLREAIQAANQDEPVDTCIAGPGTDRILFAIPSASFVLTNEGSGEDANQSGDLDIHKTVTLVGCGPENTIIDGGLLDRVMHIHPQAEVRLEEVALTGGYVEGEYGGGIYNEGTLILAGTSIVDNHAAGDEGVNGSNHGGGGGGGGGASFGGGIYNTGSIQWSPSTSLCSIRNNVATGGRGGRGWGNGGYFTGNGGNGGGPNFGSGGQSADGYAGGFASGGGGGGGYYSGTEGGAGGFSGGGGGGGARTPGGDTGDGGLGGFAGGKGGRGCCSAGAGGGGGGGLGGGLFNVEGDVDLGECYVAENRAEGGPRGGNYFGGPPAEVGGGYGGAIFVYGGSVESSAVIFEENTATTEGDIVYDHP